MIGKFKCISLILILQITAIYSTTISVISPNGSEVWDPTVRQTRSIRWSCTNTVGSTSDSQVSIEYSINNGSSWTTITSSTPNDGEYVWTLPTINSPSCIIRISSNGANDVSNATFTLNYPEILLTSIDDGAELIIDTTYKINWIYNNPVDDSVIVKYTVNGGADWATIDRMFHNDSTEFQIPAIPSTNCKLRIEDKYCPTNVYSEIAFSIVFGIVDVTYPNSGTESFIGGTTETIRWNSTGVVGNVRIEYSSDNGATWAYISENTENDGEYDWQIPDIASSNCLVRVTSIDYGAYGVGDTCNNLFTLESTPRIALTSPNGTDSWIVGTTHNITWTSVNLKSGVNIEYSSDSGSTWNQVAYNTANDGIFTWTIPDDISDLCIVRVSESLDSLPIDQSDTVFSIARPVIEITSPNGGEEWYFGETNLIEWTSIGTVGDVKIEYSNNGRVWLLAAVNTSNDGSYSWTTPNYDSDNYQIRISDASDASIIDYTDSPFTITTRPTITLLSPNSGESWTEGTSEEINWSTTGDVGDIRIEYTADNGSTWNLIADNVTNNPPYVWDIPRDPSVNCKVRVIEVSNSEVRDSSDNNFSLLVAPAIEITSPSGGETYEFGTTQSITWQTEGIVGDIRIEMSSDSCENWSLLGTANASAGSYNWTVPEDSSVNYFIRVMEIGDSVPADTTDIAFEVYGPSITVNFPNGGDDLTVGNPYNITWSSRGTVGNVMIEYRTDIDANWHEIIGVTDNDGSFNWTIPDAVSKDCRIRISEASRPEVVDLSDDAFEISGGTVRIIDQPVSQDLKINESVTFSISTLGLTPINYQWQKDGVDIDGAQDSTLSIPTLSVSHTGDYRCIASNILGSDTSDVAVLTVTGKEIVITSPNEYILLYEEDTHTIEWTSNGGVGDVMIEYSTDNGTSWNTIISSTENDGSFDWIIPAEQSNLSIIRVSEVSDPSYMDVSDAAFELRKLCKVVLSNGWNMISFNVAPIDPAVESIFKDIASLTLVKNNNGQVYMPAYGQNDIGNIDVNEGYMVYTTETDTIKVKGELINNSLTLNSGWSLIPFYPTTSMSIETALSAIVSSIRLVKNNDGQVYMPAYGQNDIGDMVPGEGYQIYMNESATLNYPSAE